MKTEIESINDIKICDATARKSIDNLSTQVSTNSNNIENINSQLAALTSVSSANINDTTPSKATTYSSSKIENLIDNIETSGGTAGADGYSPTASVTKSNGVTTISITDKNGTTTATVSDGAKGDTGTNGTNGKDGTTPTLKMGTVTTLDAGSNATATMTNSGTTYTINLSIPKGATGATGAKGDTGDSGIGINDSSVSSSQTYSSSKISNLISDAEITSNVKPTSVGSVSDMTDSTKFYILNNDPDMYIYTYQSNGIVCDYTNLFNKKTAFIGCRWSGTDKMAEVRLGYTTTGLIPAPTIASGGTLTIRIKSATATWSYSTASRLVRFSGSTDSSQIACEELTSTNATITKDGDLTTIVLTADMTTTVLSDTTEYLRLCFETPDNAVDDIIITFNEEITDSHESFSFNKTNVKYLENNSVTYNYVDGAIEDLGIKDSSISTNTTYSSRKIEDLILDTQAAINVKPTIVSSTSEMTDGSKYYILDSDADMYIYRPKSNGLTYDYTNVFNKDTASVGYRWSSSSKAISAKNGYTTTDFIPISLTNKLVIRIKSATAYYDYNTQSARISWFSSNTGSSQIGCEEIDTDNGVIIRDGDLSTVMLTTAKTKEIATGAYLNICFPTPDNAVDDIIITINEEITEPHETFVFEKTNVKYLASNAVTYNNSYVENVTSNNALPSYATDRIEAMASAINGYATPSTLSMSFMVDMHMNTTNTYSRGVLNAQKALGELINMTPIKLAIFGGDYIRASANTTKAEIYNDIQLCKKYSANYRCPSIYLRGNHDANTMQTDSNEWLTEQDLYCLLAKQNEDNEKIVFGDNYKNYGYIDFIKQNARVIFLNTSDYATEADKPFGVSVTQYNFLVSALNTDKNVIVVSHIPYISNSVYNMSGCFGAIHQTLKAFKNKTSYSGSLYYATGNSTVSCDFSNKTTDSNLVCVVTGHIHIDTDFTQDEILYITTANAENQETRESEGYPIVYKTLGTITESIFDVYTFDFTNKTIKATRYGAGTDRSFTYGTTS